MSPVAVHLCTLLDSSVCSLGSGFSFKNCDVLGQEPMQRKGVGAEAKKYFLAFAFHIHQLWRPQDGCGCGLFSEVGTSLCKQKQSRDGGMKWGWISRTARPFVFQCLGEIVLPALTASLRYPLPRSRYIQNPCTCCRGSSTILYQEFFQACAISSQLC